MLKFRLFNWIKEIFDQNRNNYGKAGHFAYGFIPALIVRELLIRKQVVRSGGWLCFITVCISVTISAFCKFIDWLVAIASGQCPMHFSEHRGGVGHAIGYTAYNDWCKLYTYSLFENTEQKNDCRLILIYTLCLNYAWNHNNHLQVLNL